VENRVLRVLASLGLVVVAILVVLRALRVARILTVAGLIGAILVVGWVLLGPALTIPRFTAEGPVVRNGTAVVVACGKKRGIHGMGAAMKYAHEPRTGGWWPVREGECTTWYHRPPDAIQRENRQERASKAHEAASGASEATDHLAVSGEQLQTEFQKLSVVEKLPATLSPDHDPCPPLPSEVREACLYDPGIVRPPSTLPGAYGAP
jgi:hypothetical protein